MHDVAALLARPRRRRVPHRRGPPASARTRTLRRRPARARRPPARRAQRPARDPRAAARHPRAARRLPGRPHDGRRGLPARHRAGRRLLRRRRRAAPVVQLPAAVRAVGRRPAGATQIDDHRRAALDAVGAWPTWVLSNHDNPRHRTRYGGPRRGPGPRRCCCSACGARRSCTPARSWAWTTPRSRPSGSSTPAGATAAGPRSRGTRPRPRLGRADPWLPWPPEADTHNVADQWADPRSTLHLYQRCLAARRASAALHAGDQRLARLPRRRARLGPLRRRRPARRARELHRRAGRPRRHRGARPPPSGWVVEVASDGGGEGSPFTGRLGPRPGRLAPPDLSRTAPHRLNRR